jgi:protein tyrosine phosphatase (PTP) superfamily phosphohydrolase (DUF442 family)
MTYGKHRDVHLLRYFFVASALTFLLAAAPFEAVEQSRLHNAHRVTEKVYSGAQPEGDEGFGALRDLGIKTIISVDGAIPDLERARRFGLRYVHIPIGYDAVPPEKAQAIAKAISELPGPIYVHCHHGKHRSAAAVAVACVMNGTLDAERAEDVLKTFGTGENYSGLWRDARAARPLAPGVLDSLFVEYVEAAKVSDLAGAMVGVDRHFDHLKLVQKAGWAKPVDHPDLDPPHEALQLLEHYREIARLPATAQRTIEFRDLLADAEAHAGELHDLLKASTPDRRAIEAKFGQVSQSCTNCHRAYRD